MKHEAEEELIKTLNGQISELPSVAKTMVQQYQTSAIVLSVVWGVLFIVVLAGTIWLAVWCHKKSKTDYGDYDLGLVLSITCGGALSLLTLLMFCYNLIHACAPIASIISSIFIFSN